MLNIVSWLAAAALVLINGIFQYQQPQPQPEPSVGIALPSGVAVFETSLQSRISSTDTSMTLVSTSTRGDGSLTGYQCFTVDEGRTDAEYICGTLTSAKTVTGLERGIDPNTASTSNSALQFAHRVGANVKVTDYPLIQRMRHQLSGADTLANLIRYDTSLTPASGGDLVDYDFVTALAFNGAGVIDATNAARGVVELASGCEAASSTASGSSGILAIPASLATSTYSAILGACKVVVTGNNGKLSGLFIATSSLFAYTLPAADGSASTTLRTNGTGTVSFDLPSVSVLHMNGTIDSTNSTASTTLRTITIPANTLTAGKRLEAEFFLSGTNNAASGEHFEIRVGTNAASSSVAFSSADFLTASNGARILLNIQANTASVQTYFQSTNIQSNGGNTASTSVGALSMDSTVVNNIYIVGRTTSASDTATIRSSVVKLISP